MRTLKIHIGASLLIGVLVIVAGYAALFIAPEERTMGLIQRIFYMHLPAWISMFTAFTITLFSNIAYLRTRRPKWDSLGVSSAEVGVICGTIGLITGPIWAHPVWGVWWTWDARLTTTFILWLLYISYICSAASSTTPSAAPCSPPSSESSPTSTFRSFTFRIASGAPLIRNPSFSADRTPASIPR